MQTAASENSIRWTDDELVGPNFIARVTGVKKKTVQNLASAKPHLLPPRVHTPLSNAVFYRRSDVETWVKENFRVEKMGTPPKQRGRPRKH